MYMILWWKKEGSRDTKDYLDAIRNLNGSITLFDTVKEADAYASKSEQLRGNKADMRVISIEGVSL